MQKTTAEIRVAVAGPEAKELLDHVKGEIVGEFRNYVERVILSAGELVVTLAYPYRGNPERAETAEVPPMPEPEQASDAKGNADDCDCPACQAYAALKGKPITASEVTLQRISGGMAAQLLAAILAGKQDKPRGA